MTVSQSALAWLYLYAAILGIALGAFYDFFRITRVFLGMHYSRRAANRLRALHLPFLTSRRKTGESRALGIVIFFEDLIFCMVAGIALVILFYEVNSGRFRAPALLCAGAGFLFYRGTIGRAVMLFSEVIAFVIETGVRYLVFFTFYPIRVSAKWLGAQIAALNLDKVILVGDTLVGAVKRGYEEADGDKEKISVCKTLEGAQEELAEWLGEGDAVLFLNDLPDVY